MNPDNPAQKRDSHWLDKIPWRIAPIAVLLAFLPFSPQPHLIEKIDFLFSGTLTKPLDIFDLFMHGLPITLILFKGVHHLLRGQS
ncbi:MAG: hypothetical protein HQL72_13220 [Magnetococcales bacterium]|nr:hypothetical protein [Magnetococcales bacterium]